MAKYIQKSALVAEIERTYNFHKKRGGKHDASICDVLYGLLHRINTLEVKEADLEKEIQKHLDVCLDVKFPTTDIELVKKDVAYTARKFFELGIRVNNPITAADRGIAEEIILSLKQVENDYRIDHTKEIEWIRNQVQKGE